MGGFTEMTEKRYEHWTQAFKGHTGDNQEDYDLRLKIYEYLTFEEIKASKKRFQQTKQLNDDLLKF